MSCVWVGDLETLWLLIARYDNPTDMTRRRTVLLQVEGHESEIEKTCTQSLSYYIQSILGHVHGQFGLSQIPQLCEDISLFLWCHD